MLPFCAGVSRGGYDDNPLTDGFLGRMVDYAARTGNVFVTAERDIQDSNVEPVAVLDNPLDSPRDIVLCDSSSSAGLKQDELGTGCQPAIYAVAVRAVAGGDD
jgi:hypothetical protein